MRKILIIALANSLLCLGLFGQDFGETLKDDANSLWVLTPNKFKTTFGSPEIYKWKSALKNVLVYNSKGAETELLFFEQPIKKANFRFKSKQLQGISLSLVKSDELSDKEAYLANVKNLKDQIAGLENAGSPKVRKRKSNGGYRYAYSWKSKKYYISLISSYAIGSEKNFKPRNIKFSIFNRISVAAQDEKNEEDEDDTDTASSKPEDGHAAINSKITTTDKGDHHLTVPMIKETSAEECMTVCMKRIYKQNGIKKKSKFWKKVTKNLRMKAKSPRGFKKLFIYIAQEARCRIKRLVTVDDFDDYNAITSFLRKYNEQARKLEKKKITSFRINNFNKLTKVMDEEVFLKVMDNPQKTADFKTKICKEINAGKPVLWVAFIGVIEETPKPIVAGGYVRLIVGYNSKTNEMIYSDNWGKGHEMKKMSWEKAWAMTLSALAVTIKK
jgi:hypothetical protein